MKTILICSTLLLSSLAYAQEMDSTGLEGDHLNLEAVMEVFKNSESPEDFEKQLNSDNSKVNNLDLNGDGEVDYIRVVDTGDSIAHVLTLQVPVNESESQDVATIELEQTDNDVVQLQIVGDEELYGENYILLPESAGHGPLVVNVIMWKPVRFMWRPNYVFWVSPWRYRHYPGWYRPWKRRTWHAYHGRIIIYRGGCRRVHRRHFSHGHVHFYHRTHSATFHHAHHHKHSGKTMNGKTTVDAKGKTTKVGATHDPSAHGVTSSTTKNTTVKNVDTNKGHQTERTTQRSATQPITTKVTTTTQNKGTVKKSTEQQRTQKSTSTKGRKRPGTTGVQKSNGGSRRSSGGRTNNH